MNDNEPVWEWIKKGRQYKATASVLYPNEIRYQFKTPFSDVGEPYGNFLRNFLIEWKKGLISPPIISTHNEPWEGKYSDQTYYTYFTTKYADMLSFYVDFDKQGFIRGLSLEGHHTKQILNINSFLDEFVKMPQKIEYLTITNDFLDSFPANWGELTNLERIYFRCPKMVTFPEEIIKCWSYINYIYLHSSPMETIPLSFCRFPELTDLYLEACPNLQTLPPEIGQLPNLKRLFIVKCPRFTHLPPEIGQLRQLLGIYLIDLPEFIHIPPEIGQIPTFRGITLSYLPKFLEIPPEIGQCAQFRSLELDHLPLLRELPDIFDNCYSFHDLKIDSSVFLDSIPVSLAQTKVSCYYQYVHDKVIVPPDIGNKVQVIDSRFVLSHDPIESLDRWIQQRGELGLDIESARAFKAWFIENIPKRAYPWFGGLDGNQPTTYEQIQWLITHPHLFTEDDLDWIDQQVTEWADHDMVNTHTHADWERFKQEQQVKKSSQRR